MKTTRPFVLIFPGYTVTDSDESPVALVGELDHETFIAEDAAKVRYAALVKLLGKNQVYLVREAPIPAEIDDNPRVVFGAPRTRKRAAKVDGAASVDAPKRGGRPKGSKNKPKATDLIVVDANANGAA